MLTKLEIDGFKNLLDFDVAFGPFTCIAGPNGVGKSNIFDAIRFLSLLADHTLLEAALKIRDGDPETSSPSDVFWTTGKNRRDSLRIAAEMIVPSTVVDDFGRQAEPSSTFLRYEVQIGYLSPDAKGNLGRLVLLAESLDYIPKGEAAAHLHFPHSASEFRNRVVQNSRRGAQFISTEQEANSPTQILIHQDGGSSGRPNKAPARGAPKTIVATTNTSDYPTILAARREMQSWRTLALEPSAMRSADRFHTEPRVTTSGDHLAATLYRLENLERERGSSGGVNARLANRLSEVVRVDDVRVNVDDTRQILTLEIVEPSGLELAARSVSDGTLRFLTLAIMLEDEEATGVLCMEEPENGIHPARLEAMVRLLRELAINAEEPPGAGNVMRQVIVATHSPFFVALQNEDDLLLAEAVKIRSKEGERTQTLKCRPLADTWRADRGRKAVGKGSILAYLKAPPGAQLELDDVAPNAAE